MLLNSTTDYKSFTDEMLESSLSQVELEIKEQTNQKKRICETLLVRKNDELEALLKAKEEPYGSVHVGNFDFTYPKKVVYNQKELAALAQQIMSAGEDPSDYIEISYDVKESKFKAWPTAIKNQFIAARTVSRGNPAVKIATKEKE